MKKAIDYHAKFIVDPGLIHDTVNHIENTINPTGTNITNELAQIMQAAKTAGDLHMEMQKMFDKCCQGSVDTTLNITTPTIPTTPNTGGGNLTTPVKGIIPAVQGVIDEQSKSRKELFSQAQDLEANQPEEYKKISDEYIAQGGRPEDIGQYRMPWLFFIDKMIINLGHWNVPPDPIVVEKEKEPKSKCSHPDKECNKDQDCTGLYQGSCCQNGCCAQCISYEKDPEKSKRLEEEVIKRLQKLANLKKK